MTNKERGIIVFDNFVKIYDSSDKWFIGVGLNRITVGSKSHSFERQFQTRIFLVDSQTKKNAKMSF
jgi:hypothetical protein